MLEQDSNRLLFSSFLGQDCARQMIAGLIQRVIGQFVVPGFHGNSITILGHLLLKASGDRLLALCFLKLDERVSRTGTVAVTSVLLLHVTASACFTASVPQISEAADQYFQVG